MDTPDTPVDLQQEAGRDRTCPPGAESESGVPALLLLGWGGVPRPALGTERPHQDQPAASSTFRGHLSRPCPSPAPQPAFPRQREEAGQRLGPACGLPLAHPSATSVPRSHLCRRGPQGGDRARAWGAAGVTGPSRGPHSAPGSGPHPVSLPQDLRLSCLPPTCPGPPDHRDSPSLQPGATHPAPGGWHGWGHAYLPLGGGPEVGLTELHGLLQGSLLVHLSKDTPTVSGPRRQLPGRAPRAAPGGPQPHPGPQPPGPLFGDQLATLCSRLWPRDFTLGGGGWGGLDDKLPP